MSSKQFGTNLSPPLPVAPTSVEVLNGMAKVGDTVGLAVRDGNLAAMRMGVITRFEVRKKPYSSGWNLRMKIRVTKTSAPGGVPANEIGTENFDRVVIVSSAERTVVVGVA